MTFEEHLANPDFKEWFDERPAHIQALIRRLPPGNPYRVSSGWNPGWIHGYHEELEGGKLTLTVNIDDPLFPRQVFGLEESDLTPWEGSLPEEVQASEQPGGLFALLDQACEAPPDSPVSTLTQQDIDAIYQRLFRSAS
jgi:hypothetical protein